MCVGRYNVPMCVGRYNVCWAVQCVWGGTMCVGRYNVGGGCVHQPSANCGTKLIYVCSRHCKHIASLAIKGDFVTFV
jgi:hypothetical protein